MVRAERKGRGNGNGQKKEAEEEVQSIMWWVPQVSATTIGLATSSRHTGYTLGYTHWLHILKANPLLAEFVCTVESEFLLSPLTESLIFP